MSPAPPLTLPSPPLALALCVAGYCLFIANPSFAPVGAIYSAGDGAVLWLGAGAATIGA